MQYAPAVIIIARRFCGPPESGNGGYSAGSIAEIVGGAVEVSLRRPPPLDKALDVERDESTRALEDGQLVLEATQKELELAVPAPPGWDEAQAMSKRYVGFEHHIFPKCFTCGPAREEGDGLRIFAGREGAEGPVAAAWLPAESVATEGTVWPRAVWAALDCPGYFAVAQGPEMAVLGRMHAELTEPVRAGGRYVVTGWPIDRDGRKLHAGTAIHDEDGRCVGRARQTWIVIAPR